MPLPLPLGEVDLRSKDGEGEDANLSAALAQQAALQMPFPSTTPPVKMRLERSAELVGAKPLHLLTQTALPLKSPTGAFIAALRSANAVAPNAKFKIFFPLKMRRATRSAFPIVLPSVRGAEKICKK